MPGPWAWRSRTTCKGSGGRYAMRTWATSTCARRSRPAVAPRADEGVTVTGRLRFEVEVEA